MRWLLVLACVLGCQAAPAPAPPPAPAAPPTAPKPDANAAIAEVLRDRREAVAAVVLDAGDGHVIGLGRHRGADPATRAFRPGSTVKPLVAWMAAHAAEPAVAPGEQVACEREYAKAPGFTCFDRHSVLGLADAIAVSCNVYFYELGSRLGNERLRAGFDDFGLGKVTGLVPGESAGALGDGAAAPALATGHGPFHATLLQLARAYVSLAQRLRAPEGALDGEILEGLVRAVHGEHGTGRLAAVPGVEIAGKTGTAEATNDDTNERENGWFVGWAPARAPEIVVAVVALEAEPGGKSAAPVAGRIFAALLNGSRTVQ